MEMIGNNTVAVASGTKVSKDNDNINSPSSPKMVNFKILDRLFNSTDTYDLSSEDFDGDDEFEDDENDDDYVDMSMNENDFADSSSWIYKESNYSNVYSAVGTPLVLPLESLDLDSATMLTLINNAEFLANSNDFMQTMPKALSPFTYSSESSGLTSLFDDYDSEGLLEIPIDCFGYPLDDTLTCSVENELEFDFENPKSYMRPRQSLFAVFSSDEDIKSSSRSALLYHGDSAYDWLSEDSASELNFEDSVSQKGSANIQCLTKKGMSINKRQSGACFFISSDSSSYVSCTFDNGFEGSSNSLDLISQPVHDTESQNNTRAKCTNQQTLPFILSDKNCERDLIVNMKIKAASAPH